MASQGLYKKDQSRSYKIQVTMTTYAYQRPVLRLL